ncbi:hypothetical protein F5B20DRAFT_533303 [Whalleya microplaca]|nr:hypothetical protein F5B20DRAFT_533303 [Whalleya microplaca]
MAEFDDIEYEGIGEGRLIAMGSERCFRDHSPGDTVISLGNDERAISYTRSIPSFQQSTDHRLQSEHPTQQSQTHEPYIDISFAGIPDTATSLDQHALAVMNSTFLASGDAMSPFQRYLSEPETHEQLAIGIGLDVPGNLSTPNPYVRIHTANRQDILAASLHQYITDWQPATPDGRQEELRDEPLFSSKSSPGLAPSEDPHNSSSSELGEMLNILGSPEWESKTPEDQVDHVRKVSMLKRRVKSQINPRQAKAPRLRKRDHTHTRKTQQPSSETGSNT